ncbi:Succinyl-diaminopimelate desuccinylase [Corynebacterium deserti GIMN1.010]|uniref:Succinyl-diaminopimelate desuccinylase n=1 Tax=Corynebacterium deserti GIMN1.010 TaxID=931089 RepID=A0A0M4CL72_9CORY|nr:succinyl-diaminopimelate desuccinylase [Corynebacterium deserti]ALC05510.1 Succinyl-diaminopimelate desuccinylase [Corynebacterium deserti GIMN1.010]
MTHLSNTETASTLDLLGDPVLLTQRLVDIPSPSGEEKQIADEIEAALRALNLPGVEVLRFNNNVLARTNRGLDSRVMLAGHIDTVPIADNVPSRMEDGIMYGCGTVDMKSGLAVYLHTFATLAQAEHNQDLQHDLTLIAYECEEVADHLNGLGHIQTQHPEWLQADLALLGEPTGGWIEAGCQGNLRIKVTAHGVRAHSARSWLGDNAMHKLSPIIAKISAYEAKEVEIDGLTYREGLNIVRCESGVANNVIPDEAWMNVNFRFAPNRSVDEAVEHVVDKLGLSDAAGIDWAVEDAAGGALPGLGKQVTRGLIDAVGPDRIRAKFGWTDVSRFSAMGVPALNFGSGDPSFAHKRDEQCPVDQITSVAETLRSYLSA